MIVWIKIMPLKIKGTLHIFTKCKVFLHFPHLLPFSYLKGSCLKTVDIPRDKRIMRP
jgi:hypothetical protein